MSLLSLTITLLVLAAFLLLAIIVIFNSFSSKGKLARALNMSLFLITVPRESIEDGPQSNSQAKKDLIAPMEQLFSSLANIKAKGWNKFLYGSPYIVLEMAVHHVGEQIHFYMAVPRAQEELIEKQIHGVFPSANVEKVKDYNIFNPEGVSLGGYFSLAQNSILPIRTYQVLPVDPLGQISTTLSKLQEEGEGAALQILIRPSAEQNKGADIAAKMNQGLSFNEALYKKGTGAKEEKEKAQREGNFGMGTANPDLIKAIQNKSSKLNFDANIRVLVSSHNEQRSSQILSEIESSFVQFSSPDMNSFKLNKLRGRWLNKLVFNYSFRLFNEKQKVVLSTEELASIYHLPISGTAGPKVKFLKSKSAEPPANLPKEGVMLGINNFRGVQTPVFLSKSDRRRHLYIVGQTGTGKSSLMKEMARQDIMAGEGVCVIDPHGDFAEYVLSVVPQARAEDVIYFNPGDLERPLGLNMLEIDPSYPEQKSFVINELLSIIDRLYNLKETGGPIFEKYFKNALLLLLDNYANEIPTLADISRVLVNDKYRAEKLSRETNPLVKEFWEMEAAKAGGEASLANMAPYISSKVDTFVSNEYLRPIINQKKSAFNFREVIDGRKILVVNLSKGKIGDINANLLGMIITGKLLMAALSRVDIPEDQRQDFYLYIDEFQNFTTESIATILSEARKYKLDLTVAHQFIKQLDEKIKNAVFGNVGSMAVFRVGADDAEFLKNQFEPVFTAQDLINIDNFNCYAKLLTDNQTSRPFNLSTNKEAVGSAEISKSTQELSRTKFGRARAEVEQEILSYYKQ